MRSAPTLVALATALIAGAVVPTAADDACGTKTLTTNCTQHCDGIPNALSCVSVATTGSDGVCNGIAPLGACPVADYGCRAVCFLPSQNDATEFRFYVPFGGWTSDREQQLRKNATAWWQTHVDSLPTSSVGVPHLRNDYLTTIGTLQLPSKIRAINLAGGYSSDVGIKGKVVNVSLASDAFANATSVTSLSLAHLHLGDATSSIGSLLPRNLTRLRLVNCLLDNVPSDLSQLTALGFLNLSMNYLSSVPSTMSLPALQSLDLTKNNLTNFEAASLVSLETLDLRENMLEAIPSNVYMLPRLKRLRMTQNPLRLAVLTPDQYTFLSQLSTLELDGFLQSVDCASGVTRTLLNDAVRVCVTTRENVERISEPVSDTEGSSSNTVMIVSIVGGVFAALLVASFAWKKFAGPSSPKNAASLSANVGVEVAKHESEGSDSSGGDFIAYGNGQQPKPTLVIAKSTPDHSSTTTTSHSQASSPADGIGLLPHSNSSNEQLLSHHSSSSSAVHSTSTGSSGGSNTSHSHRSPMTTRTIVISRPLERSNLSGLSLWDDGELNAYLLKYEDIEDIRLIGSGGHGVVWLVYYRQTRQLASKRLVRDQLTRQKTFDFVAEIKLVAQLHHPSIVAFVGVAWTVETDLQALFEYMPNGDLRTYLEHTSPDGSAGTRKRTIGSSTKDGISCDDEPSSTVLSWVHDKWQLALSISEALVYVHSFLPPLVHRDLKSRNVLLSADIKAKLSDFGVSRFESEDGTMTTSVGTGKWLAPEVIAGSKSYDASCDIYAFGVLLSELDTHRLPYDDVVGDHGGRLPEIALLQRIAADELKPTFTATCPRDILELALRCLSFEPAKRPSAVNVAFDLRTFARKHGFYDVEQL